MVKQTRPFLELSSYHILSKVIVCRNPFVCVQGTSQSMPWLAELVESNDSSLDVLPVQCLCEFLLHDSTSETSSRDEDEGADKQKKQQVSVDR